MSKEFLLDLVRYNLKSADEIRRLSETPHHQYNKLLHKFIDEIAQVINDSNSQVKPKRY